MNLRYLTTSTVKQSYWRIVCLVRTTYGKSLLILKILRSQSGNFVTKVGIVLPAKDVQNRQSAIGIQVLNLWPRMFSLRIPVLNISWMHCYCIL